MHAEAGKSQVGRQLQLRYQRPELEHRGVVGNRAHCVRAHFIDVDAPVKVESSVEELHFEERVVVPERAGAVKADVAELVVIQLREILRQVR